MNLENSRPDFVLETNDTTVPAIAIFTDGHAYHATVAHNRLADDAAKRQVLRDTGRVVLAVTAADVVAAENGVSTPPPWYHPKLVQKLISRQAFMASPAAYDELRGGPVDRLIDWISAPSPTNATIVARAVPLFPTAAAATVTTPADVSLAEAARSLLLDLTPTGSGGRPVKIWRSGACALAVEMVGPTVHAALVLDDREAVLDAGHADAWREWLRLSNALALRDWPTVITTTGLAAVPKPAPAPSTVPDLAPEWQEIFERAAPGIEQDLIAALARAGGLPLPEVGAEGPDGIPIDLSWPDLQIAVAMPQMPAEDRDDLIAAGWQLVEPSPDVIVTALAGAGGNQ